MPNVPKPDLERGNYIAYTDESNTIVDNAGGGDNWAVGQSMTFTMSDNDNSIGDK